MKREILTTRYRDIPWKAIGEAHSMMSMGAPAWEDMRGREINIYLPAIPNDRTGCGGPWFEISDGIFAKLKMVVCPHLAELD